MSGDTPTVEHSLDCPGCGAEVFIRDVAAWYTDEEEHCAGCGSRVMVALDEDDADPDLLTARVYIYEHGGEVVARLLGEVARLTPDTPGEVSDHVRARFAEASAATLAGEGGCIGAGCIPAHQACEVLDAYDDARAEVERLTELLTQDENDRKECEAGAIERDRMRKEFAATIERLTELHGRAVSTLESTIGDLETRLLAEGMTAAALEQTIEKLRRDLCQAWGLDELGQRFPGQAARDRSARVVAKRQGWDCYPEDSTTDEPGGDQ